MVRLNFIENKPSHDFVPYFSGYLGALGYVNESNSQDYKMAGGSFGLGLGFNWFPFSEIFALNLELRTRNGFLEDDGNPKIELEVRQTKLKVGWNIYF